MSAYPAVLLDLSELVRGWGTGRFSLNIVGHFILAEFTLENHSTSAEIQRLSFVIFSEVSFVDSLIFSAASDNRFFEEVYR